MGKRGPKKGAIYKPTLDKARAREALRTLVLEHMSEMTAAQIQHAKGISHFMLRGTDGRFERCTDADQILQALNSGDATSYYIHTKDPSVQAYTDLMNRALDKPSEHVEVSGAGGEPIVLQWKE
jgi:hypothetical protein